MPEQYFIIDFDSTFIQTEGLEELAEVVLKDNPKKEEILEEIKKITNLGMEGKIGFRESLKKRLALLKANRTHLEKVKKVILSQAVLPNGFCLLLKNLASKKTIFSLILLFSIKKEKLAALILKMRSQKITVK